MSFFDVFSQNVLVRWLAGDRSRVALAVTMAGVRLGERLLVAGASDLRLLGALAARTGLSGHVLLVDPDPARITAARAAAADAGVLIDDATAPLTAMPSADACFDIAVLGSTTDGAPLSLSTEVLAEIHRLLRPGGRLVVVGPRQALQHTDSSADLVGIRAVMTRAGFLGARLLAEREGLAFLEGGRSGTDPAGGLIP